MSQDPLGFAGGDPDVYRYALNQPVRFLDPSGLESINSPAGALALKETLLILGVGVAAVGVGVAGSIPNVRRVGAGVSGFVTDLSWKINSISVLENHKYSGMKVKDILKGKRGSIKEQEKGTA